MENKKTVVALLLSLTLVANGCCHVNLDAFRASPMSSQITQYADAVARKCVTNDRMTLLQEIADHGCEAGDAMAQSLAQPNSRFPAEDAMTVLGFVHSGGCDLRHHAVMETLQRLSTQSPDSRIRAAAKETIQIINQYDPTKSHS